VAHRYAISSTTTTEPVEDVLEVYAVPDDPTQPVGCFDECSKQLCVEP
jgi:hypothetical protein